jgi:hypothetical protein
MKGILIFMLSILLTPQTDHHKLEGTWSCFGYRSWGKEINTHFSGWSLFLNHRNQFSTQYPWSRDTGSYYIKGDSLILHHKHSIADFDQVFQISFISYDTLILDAGEYRDASVYYLVRK